MDYMREAFSEAIWAIGNSDPNPPVGAILVDVETNEIIGRGFTQCAGAAHAEVEAIEDAKRRFTPEKIAGSHLYVTLEPCSHHGRTPPCTEAIVKNKISKVIIGRKDISSKVDGISYLEQNGVETVVVDGSKYKDEIYWTLGSFENAEQNKLPRVVMKWAQTKEGNIAPTTGSSGSISNAHSKESVFRLRKLFHATLVTPGTIVTDDPSLTARFGKLPLTSSLLAESFFEKMLLSFEKPRPTRYDVKAPIRYFMLPPLSAKWTQKRALEFFEKQTDLGDEFYFFTTDTEQATLLPEQCCDVVPSYENLDPILQAILKNGSLQVLLEAGPFFCEKVFQSQYEKALLAYVSEHSPPWEEHGTGFSASYAIRDNDDDFFTLKGYRVGNSIGFDENKLRTFLPEHLNS
ncbi:MAG: bifunctional diaminohydroxyphosphoribosylaminopyrimidine deaminase/5-amino-6-(5-phosphoribosylamino)uracil reductase RibD [Leptospirales bacterium]